MNLDEYREQLERRLGKAHEIMRMMIHKAQAAPKQVVFPGRRQREILRACAHVCWKKKLQFRFCWATPADPKSRPPSWV